MKKLSFAAIILSTPAMAHEGHATLPGPSGHGLTHLLIGLAVIATAALIGAALHKRRTEE